MNAIKTEPGESLSAIAHRIFNGDVTRFTELLDLNPSLSVFEDLTEGLNIEIPDTAQIFNYAKPVLSEISETIGGATGTISAIQDKIPPQLQGYTQEALKVLGEVNGVVGDTFAVFGKAEEVASKYGNKPVQLVRWLLGGQA
jgi:phage tail protein X